MGGRSRCERLKKRQMTKLKNYGKKTYNQLLEFFFLEAAVSFPFCAPLPLPRPSPRPRPPLLPRPLPRWLAASPLPLPAKGFNEVVVISELSVTGMTCFGYVVVIVADIITFLRKLSFSSMLKTELIASICGTVVFVVICYCCNYTKTEFPNPEKWWKIANTLCGYLFLLLTSLGFLW